MKCGMPVLYPKICPLILQSLSHKDFQGSSSHKYLFNSPSVVPAKPTSIWTSLLPTSLLRLNKFAACMLVSFGQVSTGQSNHLYISFESTCTKGLLQIFCFIQASFEPRGIFIQDLTKFLLPLKKRHSI